MPANVEALDWAADGSPLGLLIEAARTNKSTARKANPTDLSGIAGYGSYPTMTVSVVDDAAALAASGLAGICASGKVYLLDNSASTGPGAIQVSPTTGNTIRHTLSAYIRGSGGVSLGLNGQSTSSLLAVVSDRYTRFVHSMTPTASRAMIIRVEAGAKVWMILPQLEEGEPVSSVIAGDSLAAETRMADLDRCIGATSPFPGFAQGKGAMVWEGDIPAAHNGLLWRLDDAATGLDGMTMNVLSNGALAFSVSAGGVVQANIASTVGAIMPGMRFRAVCGWQQNRFELWLNGVRIGLDNAGSIPDVQRFGLGRDPGSFGVGSFCHVGRCGYLAVPPWDRMAALSQAGAV